MTTDSEPSKSAFLQVKRKEWMLLALLVGLGAFLRLYRIHEPGFTEGADKMYAATANSLYLLINWVWANANILGDSQFVTEKLTHFWVQTGHQVHMPYSCKPVYDFANAALIGLGGYQDWLLPLFSAITGVLSLLVMFKLGNELFGVRIALIATALLAGSGGGLVFSRYGQSHMLAVLFFMAGFWFYSKTILSDRIKWYWLILTTLAMALSLATHPNMGPYVVTLALGEVILLIKRNISLNEAVKRACLALTVLMFVVFSLNLPFVALRHYVGPFLLQNTGQVTWPFMTYIEQLTHHFNLVFPNENFPSLIERIYTFVVVLWAWEGLAVIVFVCAGVYWSLLRWRELEIMEWLLIAQVTIPLMFWISTESQAVYRFSAGALPSLMLVAARFIEVLVGAIERRFNLARTHLALTLCGVLLVVNIHNHWSLYDAQSAHKLAARWLVSQKVYRIGVNHPMTWEFYGIEPMRLDGDLQGVRYVAFYPRYVSSSEQVMLDNLKGKEVKVYRHRRPGKILEENLMEKSMVLKLLQYIPVLGDDIRDMRYKVLQRNDMRRIEIYSGEDFKRSIIPKM